MYEIKRVSNYLEFAKMLEYKTKCSVRIKMMQGENHIHYHLTDRYGVSMGILCVNKGVASFAPFADENNVSDNQYINIQYMVMFDEFVNVLGALKDIFTKKDGEEE